MKYCVFINTMLETDVPYMVTKNKRKANKMLALLRKNGHPEAYKVRSF